MDKWYPEQPDEDFSLPIVDMSAAIATEFKRARSEYLLDNAIQSDKLAAVVCSTMHVISDDSKAVVLLMCQAFVTGWQVRIDSGEGYGEWR